MTAALSLSGLLPLVIQIVVVAIVFWLLLWLISYVGVPEPFNKVLRVVLAVVAVLYLINLLLGLTGNAFLRW